MKKALSFFIRYIVYFVIFSFLFSFIHLQRIQLQGLVVDCPLETFNFALIKLGFLVSFPYASFIALIPTLQVTISKRYSFLQYFIPYMIICLTIWLLIVPLGIFVNSEQSISSVNSDLSDVQLSDKIFRETDSSIDYYISTNKNGSSNILRYNLPTEENPSSKIRFVNEQPTKKSIYADSLVADYFDKLKSPQYLINVLSILSKQAEKSLNDSYFSYLWFASLGLALSCMAGLRRFTRWRMLNAFNILFYTVFILVISAILYSSEFYEKTNIPIDFMKWLPNVVNLTISVVLLLVGFIQLFTKQDPNLESD